MELIAPPVQRRGGCPRRHRSGGQPSASSTSPLRRAFAEHHHRLHRQRRTGPAALPPRSPTRRPGPPSASRHCSAGPRPAKARAGSCGKHPLPPRYTACRRIAVAPAAGRGRPRLQHCRLVHGVVLRRLAAGVPVEVIVPTGFSGSEPGRVGPASIAATTPADGRAASICSICPGVGGVPRSSVPPPPPPLRHLFSKVLGYQAAADGSSYPNASKVTWQTLMHIEMPSKISPIQYAPMLNIRRIGIDRIIKFQ